MIENGSNAGVGCFCNADEKEQNMPMWAYYANNHSGVCVEYMIDCKVKKFIYPVSYDDTRAPGNSIINCVISPCCKLILWQGFFCKKQKNVPILTKVSQCGIKNIVNIKGSAYREKEKCYKPN